MKLKIIIPIITGIVLLTVPHLFKGGVISYFGVDVLKMEVLSLKDQMAKLQSEQDNRDNEIQNLSTKVVVLESKVNDMNVILRDISSDIKAMMRGSYGK